MCFFLLSIASEWMKQSLHPGVEGDNNTCVCVCVLSRRKPSGKTLFYFISYTEMSKKKSNESKKIGENMERKWGGGEM